MRSKASFLSEDVVRWRSQELIIRRDNLFCIFRVHFYAALNRIYPGKEEFDDLQCIHTKKWAYGSIQRKIGEAFLYQGRYGQALLVGTEALVSYVIPFYFAAVLKNSRFTFSDCRSKLVQEKIKNTMQRIGQKERGLPYEKLFREEMSLLKKLKPLRNMFAHILLKNDNENTGSDISSEEVLGIRRMIEDYYGEMLEIDCAMRNDPQGVEALIRGAYEKTGTATKIKSGSQTKKPTKKTEPKTAMESIQIKEHPLSLSEKTLRRLKKREYRKATVICISKKGTITGVLMDGRAVSIPKRNVFRQSTIKLRDEIDVKLLGDEKTEKPMGIIGL